MSAARAATCCCPTTSTRCAPGDRLAYIHAGSDSRARRRRSGRTASSATRTSRSSTTAASTNYNSLQTQIVSRFGHGSQFQASYTLSRTTGNVTLTGGENGVGDAPSVSDPDNRGLDDGLTQTHRPHIFNASLVLALPALERQVGRRAGSIRRLGDRHDRPGLVRPPGDRLQRRHPRPRNGDLRHGPHRQPAAQPACLARTASASGGSKEQFLNPDALTLVGIPFGTFGNSPRGVCLGPGFFQTDLAFYKNIPLGGHVKGQFRFEIFNVFNRVNFVGVDTSTEPDDVTLDTGDAVHGDQITAFTPSGSVRAGQRHARSAAGQFGFKITF